MGSISAVWDMVPTWSVPMEDHGLISAMTITTKSKYKNFIF